VKLAAVKIPSHRGFTLLEVVVAMAIVGLGVVTLLEIFSSGLRLTASSTARTLAITVGQQAFDEFLLRYRVNGNEQAEGSADGYRWRARVDRFPEGSELSSEAGWELKEISLQLRYRDGLREKELDMRTLRLVKRPNP
jgi:prepilin-type N-terminal cleavage/methylation domain-containing protein